MLKIKFFNLTIGQIVTRFYLMMGVAFILGFAQQWILMAFIAGPIAASAILGASFHLKSPKEAIKTRKAIQLDWGKELQPVS